MRDERSTREGTTLAAAEPRASSFASIPKGRRFHRRPAPALARAIVALLVASVSLEARASDLAAADRAHLQGEAHAKKAREAYAIAGSVWSEAARALSASVGGLDERARRARAAIALVSLDIQGYRGLARSAESTGAWKPVVRSASDVDTAELENVTRIVSKAVASYPRSGPEAELRDLALLYEALALTHSIRGDLDQSQADAEFHRAFDLLKASGAGEEERAWREISLLFRLRDFEGALERAGSPKSLVPLPDERRCETLGVLEAASVALGRRDVEDAYRTLRETTCRKAWESPRVSGRFGRNLLGSRADLISLVQTFHAFVRRLDLPPRAAALCRYLAARCAIELDEIALAEELLRGAEGLAAEDVWLRASIAARLSWTRDRLGDYEAAFEALARARLIARDLPRDDDLHRRLDLHQARLELSIGKLDDAAKTAADLVRSASASPSLRIAARLTVASALFKKAVTEKLSLDQAKGALVFAERELASAEDYSEKAEHVIIAAIQLGNLFREQALRSRDREEIARLRAEAIERQDRAMRAAHAAGRYELAAVAAGNLGELRLEARDVGGARAVVDWALARAKESKRFETEWRCHWYLGRIADIEGDRAKADEEYARALAIIEDHRDRMLDADAKAGFMTDKMDLFRHLVARALRDRNAELAFDYAERGRARALLESLGWRFVALSSEKESELYREYVRLAARTARAQDPSGASFFSVGAVIEDHDALKKRLRELRDRILSSGDVSRALKALLDGAPMASTEIRARLDEGETLVEYFDIGEVFVAFVVTKAHVRAVPLPVGSQELRLASNAFLRGQGADAELGSKLHGWLIGPIASLVDTERVTIVPYGVLHGFPFEALRGPHGYQIAKWEIRYLPTASVLGFIDRNAKPDGSTPSGSNAPPRRLLALADPLTDYDGDGRHDKVPLAGARLEVAAFSKSFPQPQVYYGEAAGESLLRQTRRSADVLHLACHGEFLRSRPWESTLFLAPDGDTPETDGRLRAWEVYGLDLRGLELVALSGCETGVSDILGGDDPAGLATAFFHGGATSLLVSLWKVEDKATAELMRRFYREWIDRAEPRAKALRRAKLALLEEGWSKPAQWASFVLLGEG